MGESKIRATVAASIALLILVFFSAFASAGNASVLAQSSGKTLYFREVAETYRNENNSVIILDGAYPGSPNTTQPRYVEFQGNVKQEAQIFLSKVTVWIGAVSWLSAPFAQDTLLSGQVTFTFWMESDDPDPSASGIGVGLVVLDEQGGTIGEPQYRYQYKFGNILTVEPVEYVLALSFSGQVLTGQRLALTLGAGSSIQGWQVKAYFDSLDFMSRVDFPSDIYVIPEFPTSTASVVLGLVIAVAFGHVLGQVRALVLRRRFANSPATLQTRN